MQAADAKEKAEGAPVECEKGMACLKGQENYPLCQVEKPIAELLFVAAKPLPSCSSMRFFGNGAYCTCPVRKELYRRHKV
jgi:hypothetical protein